MVRMKYNTSMKLWLATMACPVSDDPDKEQFASKCTFYFLVKTYVIDTENNLKLSQWTLGISHNICFNGELGKNIPADTWCLCNVGSTSMQRHDVASTLMRRCINVMCLLGCLWTHFLSLELRQTYNLFEHFIADAHIFSWHAQATERIAM